jgi:uncharacterized membrane protein
MSPLDLSRKKEISKFTALTAGASFGFLLVTQLISQFISGHPQDPTVRWLASVPLVLLILAVVVAMRSLRRMDELERKMHTEAMAFAFLCSLVLVFSYGFLTVADLIAPPISWLTPAMVCCWVIGLMRAVERYR